MMLSQRIARYCLLLRDSLQTNVSYNHTTQHRTFTRQARLFLINRPVLRPQLPYLSQPTYTRRLSPIDRQLLRLLSTETRKTVKDYAWLAVKWSAITWAFLGLSHIAYIGIRIEGDEWKSPTPNEWSFGTRQALREARNLIDEGKSRGYINWAAVGKLYLKTIANLEDISGDGRGTIQQEDEQDGGAIMIADVGLVGLDISTKSWPWRQGYFEALMGMARASESMEDMVRDTTRNLIFPRNVMIGLSNPDPRPISGRMAAAPREEDCVRPFDPPETYYMRILTGRGFTTSQRLESAWAYANWLEYLKLNEAAEEMYRWAIDIAEQPLPSDINIVDRKTFVLSPSDSSYTSPSDNLLRAVTLLGVHRARSGDTSSALPMLLSVLRSRHDAPASGSQTHSAEASRPSGTDVGAFLNNFKILFTPKPFPAEPPSGDDPFVRSIGLSQCDNAEIMLYIGEIMFAATPQSVGGLRWTKRAVDIAEQAVETDDQRSATPDADGKQLDKCKQCLRTGIENWQEMLSNLAADELDKSKKSSWRSWFSRAEAPVDEDAIISDALRLSKLERLIAKEKIEEDLVQSRRPGPFGMFAG